ncbi:transcription initiation factor TFIID subunit 3 isoform X2 [Phyllopteryx taeniolatus]|uniref:transcription initiation factor TFIID subunit 3 isoform X2 n=1 Tax=Phyllopteryx taeniolatus TaxID=161469 RepID=UPI002AD1F8BF|nr:transcription initiation factor TFIID subunit 3 isoform X2 [Phyllopteryx taeniolatus]
MCESYGRSLLRVSVAQICQALGWDAVQLTACDLLADVLQRYIQQMGRVCHRYSELYGRTDPVLDDVSQAFRLLGVSLSELDDYVNNLEPVAFPQQLPSFPVSKNNVLQFPQPGALFAEERKDYIPDYMPPMVSLQEEEEEVLPDTGTSAEAMQVAMEEDEEDFDDDETVNDENHPLKRPLDSPDEALGMMPTSKRPRMLPGLSPEWGPEPREPLTSLNPQRVPPPGMLPPHDTLDPLSPETPPGAPASFRPQPSISKYPDPKTLSTPTRKPKVSSPGRQRTKSPKVLIPASGGGSPIHSPPKTSKERKKSPGRTKSPKSPKSPKAVAAKPPQPPTKTDAVHKLPLSVLSERMGKENIHVRHNVDDKEPDRGPFLKAEPGNGAIEDSISAVIAKARSEREPDPFAFSSGSDSDSNGFSSPRRLTIMEPATPKAPPGAGLSASAPLHLQLGPGKWTLDDSINEVIRKVHRGGPSAQPPDREEYVSSGSASPPTPEPLLKIFEEKSKLSALDVKKKLKKELKTKLKKKEKPKDKERDKDKNKLKDKNKEKNKNKDLSKDGKILWKEFGMKEDELVGQRDFALPEGSVKSKTRDGDGSTKKDKDKHKDKKKDKEKGKKDKEKKDKGKDKSKDNRQKQAALAPMALGEVPALFGPSSCQRPPPLLPVLQDGKSKDKKKDKKEKKKKKEKEREKAKEKEREKEEKRKEKEREKEKREKEKEKEKERLRLEKVKADAPVVAPSPVIPRLTLRVGGQDKIVISKVVPNSEVKPPAPKIPAAKSTPAIRPRSPPPPPVLLPPLPCVTGPPSPLPPPPALSSSSSLLLSSPGPLMSPAASLKTPVRSVVTETVSTYVIRDEWGNQIWICPGCDKPDDGSPMIGCDDCDDWYHWLCVGILTAPPADQQWFCVKCSSKKKDKKHKKKKHKPH